MIRIPGRIPITIHPFFWVLCFGIGFLNSGAIPGTLIVAGVIFFSILIHEFGHALTAVAFGQRAQIDLVALGGLTSRHGPRLSLLQEFIIVLCGPLAGFALALISLAIYFNFPDLSGTAFHFALLISIYVNIFWTIINLFPIQPLDGGHLLRIILEGMLGVRGVKAAYFISLLFAAGIALLAFAFGQIIIGAVMFLLAFESYREWSRSMGMTVEDQDEGLQDLLKEAEQDIRYSQIPQAEEKLEQIREKTKTGVLFISATVYLAQILAQREQYTEAYEMLKPIQSKLDVDVLPLLHQLAYKSGDLKAAAALGNQTYQVNPTYQTALVNAFCYSLLQEVEPAIGWLKRAISDGVPNLAKILERSEFDPIRSNELFRAILNHPHE